MMKWKSRKQYETTYIEGSENLLLLPTDSIFSASSPNTPVKKKLLLMKEKLSFYVTWGKS